MIGRKGLFRRYYLLTLMIVLAFIWVGFMASHLVFRLTSTPNEGRHFVFYAKAIDQLSSSDRSAALNKVLEWGPMGPPVRFAIVDQNGAVVSPQTEHLSFSWKDIRLPEKPYEYTNPPRQPDMPAQELIRFSGEPPQYLYVAHLHALNRSPWLRPSGPFFWTLSSLVVSVILGIALSMVLLFRSLREKARLADSVLAELQSGNLKARFPIKRMDEFGLAMSRFNRMADEIERLVEQLKGVEKSRMYLLQELAHDLRTPVASQKNLLETLSSKLEEMPLELRQELILLALKETDYFERLVEDLLVLAQVTEPRYRADAGKVCMNDLLSDEVELIASKSRSGDRKIVLKKDISTEKIEVQGDAHLLRRMIRNAVDNAFSFTQSEVRVVLERSGLRNLVMRIEDDGKGFSLDALKSFGERRVSRMLGMEKGPRLSLGLGSVILKTIAQFHGGSVAVENREASGEVQGARVSILLPIA